MKKRCDWITCKVVTQAQFGTALKALEEKGVVQTRVHNGELQYKPVDEGMSRYDLFNIVQTQINDDANPWKKLTPPQLPVCDICGKLAVWGHEKGGLRCKYCPRT